ncbi:methyltransferase domain-containing protein [bacterium]|nr:methyltransferase domain-containing protein [bacterium]MBU1983705.1 methyltransferase domain-containing protein [bacterium]
MSDRAEPSLEDRYLSMTERDGSLVHERTDALRWDAERDIVTARYGFAIRTLKRAGAKTVLDMASGLGYGTWLLWRAGFAVKGVELSEDALPVARARYPWLTFEQGNILSFEHEPVDGLVACDVIEHLSDGRAFWAAMERLLKPGGILVVTTPRGSDSRPPTNPFHVHEYTLAEFRRLLPAVPVRTLVTSLIKPARFWIALLGNERYQRMNYRLSRCFPFHYLPAYAKTFALAIRKEDLQSALRSWSE